MTHPLYYVLFTWLICFVDIISSLMKYDIVYSIHNKAAQTLVFIILSKKFFYVFQFESFGLFTVT